MSMCPMCTARVLFHCKKKCANGIVRKSPGFHTGKNREIAIQLVQHNAARDDINDITRKNFDPKFFYGTVAMLWFL